MKIEVRVIPNSIRFSIKKKDGKVKVFLKNRAENNKANLELLKELRKKLKREIRLVSGKKSRKKVLEIDITSDQWKNFIESETE